MTIRVNGEEREVPPAISVQDLLDRLGAPADGVAVAVDGTVIRRAERGQPLQPGARVEVIRAVGGG